jgi:hypothetical protein
MKPSLSKSLAAMVIGTALLAGCNVTPTRVPLESEAPIRAGAQQFADALKSGDAAQLEQATTVDSDRQTQALARAVIDDCVKARQIQLRLRDRFGRTEDKASVVGSDTWIASFERMGARTPILQSGERVRIGDGADGTMFLRRINGQWKVELVPTLVAESGGKTKMSDAVVSYRFDATRAANQMLLERIQGGEFATLADYQQAKNEFWFKYMSLAANGQDPREKLLSTLPPLPAEPAALAIDR